MWSENVAGKRNGRRWQAIFVVVSPCRSPIRETPDSKEAADAAMAADHTYNDCMYHHLVDYGRKTKDPARDVVEAAHGACWYEWEKLLLAAMHKAQPTWERDWLDKRDREIEPDEMSIVLEARSE
jgi:hypothetical protein